MIQSGISRLLVVSHVTHYQHGGPIHAYEPYAREIEMWADLFPEVVIAAPSRTAHAPGDAAPIKRSNVTMAPQLLTGGETIGAKIDQLVKLPALVFGLASAMRRADAIHIRCPGNLGLLGAVMAPLFTRRLVAKYAGQWNGTARDAWTTRMQRGVLRSAWWRGPVTVYGDWPNQPPHITPFFTSVLEEHQIARARIAAMTPRREPPMVLFVGRLSRSKNVDVLLAALADPRVSRARWRAVIAGDGPERARLEEQARQLGVADRVTFAGAVAFDRVLSFYEEASVLVLASDTEGWPKAITEAMAFGVVCIGSDCGLVPRILGDGRGLVVPPRDRHALSEALGDVLTNGPRFAPMRERAARWAQQYSLESLRRELGYLLSMWWGTTLGYESNPLDSQRATTRPRWTQ